MRLGCRASAYLLNHVLQLCGRPAVAEGAFWDRRTLLFLLHPSRMMVRRCDLAGP